MFGISSRYVGWIGRFVFVLLLALLLAPSVHSQTPPPPKSKGIAWFLGSFEDALAAVKKKGTLLFLDMYADWCMPCKRYESEVFSKAEVVAHLEQGFLSIKRDGMVGEGAHLSKRYNCVTYPCLLVIDAEGREVERITQFMEASPFLLRLKEIQAGKDTLASLLQLHKADPSDTTLRFRIGYRLAYRGDPRAEEFLLHVGRNPIRAYPHLAPRALYVLTRIYYRNTLRDCTKTMDGATEYLQRYPRGEEASRIRSLIRWCQRRKR